MNSTLLNKMQQTFRGKSKPTQPLSLDEKTPIKIAVISDRVYPYFKGGAEKRYWEIYKHLVHSGFEISYFTGQWPGMPKKVSIDDIELNGVYQVGEFYKNGKKSIWETIKYTFFLIPYLAFKDYGLIECEQFPVIPIILCKFFSLIRRKCLIVTWHEVWGLNLWLSYIGFLGLVGALLDLISVHCADKIISVSPLTTIKLINSLKVPSEKIETISNGIDSSWDRREGTHHFEITKSSSHSDNFIDRRNPVKCSDVIYVGRLIEHKNVSVLIGAIRVLAKDNPEINCLILGDGPEMKSLVEQVSSLELEKNIYFEGTINNEKRVYSYLKSSRVFVLPSVREGFGISVLEANACGLPALVINCENNAACSLIVEGVNGYTCDLDEDMIAKLILHILNSPRNRYAAECEQIAQDYDWTEISARVDCLYQEVS